MHGQCIQLCKYKHIRLNWKWNRETKASSILTYSILSNGNIISNTLSKLKILTFKYQALQYIKHNKHSFVIFFTLQYDEF